MTRRLLGRAMTMDQESCYQCLRECFRGGNALGQIFNHTKRIYQEEEHTDRNPVVIPQHRIYTTSDDIKSVSITISICIHECASVVLSMRRTARGADDVCCERSFVKGHWRRRVQRATRRSVEGILIVCTFVYTFDDIDFASVWPIRSNCPPGRPQRATVWHCFCRRMLCTRVIKTCLKRKLTPSIHNE
jgi:hypothetical protein